MPLEWSRAARGPAAAKVCPGGQPQPPSIVLHWTPGNARASPEAARKLDLARTLDLPDTASITIETFGPKNLKSDGSRLTRSHATSDADPANILAATPLGIRYSRVRSSGHPDQPLQLLKASRRIVASCPAVLGKTTRCRTKPKRYQDLRPN